MLSDLIFIAAGGALGAVGRFLVTKWALAQWGPAFPYGTLIVNVTGSFLLGVLITTFAARAALPGSARILLTVGFLGSYTTFATFSVESVNLALRGGPVSAAVNVLANNGVALLGAALGIAVARLWS